MKTIIPDVNLFKVCIAAGTISPKYLQKTSFLLSVRWSVIPEYLLWNLRSHEVQKMELAPSTKATYTTGVIWIPCLNFGMFSTGDQDFGFVDIYT